MPINDPANWERRADGSQKGQGFLGLLQRPDGGISSELSIGVNLNGKEVEIPSLVPTLNPREIRHLLTANPSDPIPQPIVQKAVEFARSRAAQGLPYFAQDGEQYTSIYPQFQRVQMTAPGASYLTSSRSSDVPLSSPYALQALSQLVKQPE